MVVEAVVAFARAALGRAAGAEKLEPVIVAFEQRAPIARDRNREFDQASTMGERLADRIAAVGGSWGFIIGFGVCLCVWVLLNGAVLTGTLRFDPYPFVFLNLILSMLAAIQAPIIMMSQNRQSTKDRLDAQHDFEVNLKAELEIMALHEKLDQLQREHAIEFAALKQLLQARGLGQA